MRSRTDLPTLIFGDFNFLHTFDVLSRLMTGGWQDLSVRKVQLIPAPFVAMLTMQARKGEWGRATPTSPSPPFNYTPRYH